MILNISQEALAKHHAHYTATEIAQQPQTWQQTAQLVADPALAAFLSPLVQRAKNEGLRIIFTGAGTSAFIGGVVAPLLSQYLATPIEAIASTDLVSNPTQYLFAARPTLLVSFARSGNSPESLGAVDSVEAVVGERYHLAITNNRNGELFKRCQNHPNRFALALPESTHDQSFAMTSSATNMMLAALMLFAPEQCNAKWLANLTACSEQILTQDLNTIKNLATENADRIVYLGSGHLQALAREAALKLLELTQGKRLGFFESSMGFRHGPKSLVDSQTLIFIFGARNRYTAQYDSDLYQELQRDQKAQKVILVGQDPIFNADFSALDDGGMIFPSLIIAQIYAFYSALHLGISPDNPCPSGEVNRVVQGVTLYPFHN